MQQNQIANSNNASQQQATSGTTSGIASISQPAQRYDYSQQQTLQNNTLSNNSNKSISSASFYANFQKAGSVTSGYSTGIEGNKWLGIKSGNQQQNRRGGASSQFKPKRAHSSGGTNVPIFYCEVCKISCAGPQVIFFI